MTKKTAELKKKIIWSRCNSRLIGSNGALLISFSGHKIQETEKGKKKRKMGTEINKPVQKQKLLQSEARPGKTFLKRTTVEEMKTWADKATRSCFSFLKWKKNSWCNSQVYMFVTRPNPERFWTNSGFALWHFKPATCNFTANVWCGVGSWHRSYIDHAVVPSVCVCVCVRC